MVARPRGPAWQRHIAEEGLRGALFNPGTPLELLLDGDQLPSIKYLQRQVPTIFGKSRHILANHDKSRQVPTNPANPDKP